MINGTDLKINDKDYFDLKLKCAFLQTKFFDIFCQKFLVKKLDAKNRMQKYENEKSKMMCKSHQKADQIIQKLNTYKLYNSVV